MNHPILHSLDDTEALLQWSEIEKLLATLYASKTGRPGYPLPTLFRSLLPGAGYRLSDVQLAQSLTRDLLFRKFCHLELDREVPEASTLGRFRTRLVEQGLWDQRLAEINRQSVTPGNVHDSQERDTLLPGDETALYADAAYSSQQTRDKLAQLGIDDQVQRKGYRGHPLPDADQCRNKAIAVTRAGGERPFATCKRHYNLSGTRFMGLAKNTTFYGLAAMAANIRKGASFLTRYGLPNTGYAG